MPTAEAIREPAAGEELRTFTLIGASGHVRTETLDGREYLVVPVVALMEGVIQAVNADTPEFVPLATLRRAAATWNGRPVVLGHPKKNGRQCSANSPDIDATHRIGTIYNSRIEGTKLLQEAWIDKEKIRKRDVAMYDRLLAEKSEEVSVGAFVITVAKDGAHNGKSYKAEWLETSGDHLAFLPGGRGACSNEMGCGTYRSASYLVTAEALEELPEALPVLVFTALEGESLDQRMQAVNNAVYEKWKPQSMNVPMPSSGAYPVQIFDDYVIVRANDGETFSVTYEVKGGKVVLGEPKKVEQKWVEARARMADCAACNGSGSKDGNPCEVCDGVGQMKILLGRRNSAEDAKTIQTLHDHAVRLGAQCTRENYETLVESKNIRHEGGRWALYSKDNKTKLASHDTEAEAIAHQTAIDAVLHRS